MVLDGLKESGVDVSNTKVLEHEASGQAYIFLLPSGENSIIIHGGANTAWDPDLESLDPNFTEAIESCKVLLLQREIPEHINIIAAKLAHS